MLKKSSSVKAQKQNFETERKAGKPIKQAYALSKSVQREAKKKGK